jgi:hypothetical protein
LEEVCREIGVLLLVFVPIDFLVVEYTPERRNWLLIFLAIGLFLLVGSVIAEYRRLRVD